MRSLDRFDIAQYIPLDHQDLTLRVAKHPALKADHPADL